MSVARHQSQSQSSVADQHVPTTPDGQPLGLSDPHKAGIKSWEDTKRDNAAWWVQPSQTVLGARTTFHAKDVKDQRSKHAQFGRLFRLQHGRQHPGEKRLNGYSESWDGQKVRQEDVGTYRFAAVLLSQAGVTGRMLRHIAGLVVQEDLRGFNKHYAGLVGATFGFAMVERYDDVEAAKQSTLVDEAEKYDQYDLDGAQLAEYVFRKYGGES